MRFLLTSGGISNTSIHNALVDLLGKPIAESSALCIPTGAYVMLVGVVEVVSDGHWKLFTQEQAGAALSRSSSSLVEPIVRRPPTSRWFLN